MRSPLSNFLRQRWLAALLFVFASAAHAAAPNTWSIVDLGALGSTGATASGLNNRGDVVGYSNAPRPVIFPGQTPEAFHAFLWQNGVMFNIATPQVFAHHAMGINERGTIVATVGGDEIWLWRDGQWSSLGFFGSPSDINRSETIVGQRWTGNRYEAFSWTDGVLRHLGTLGGSISHATAVNDKGAVVGGSETFISGQVKAVLWQGGNMFDLGTLGGEDSVAMGINNHGVIVGWSHTQGQEAAAAFVADTRTGVMHRLMNLSGNHFATAINDRGAVVGTLGGMVPGQAGAKSFLYDERGGFLVLEDLPAVKAAGWTQLVPVAINDRGAIAGWGFRPGQLGARSFLLQPR